MVFTCLEMRYVLGAYALLISFITRVCDRVQGFELYGQLRVGEKQKDMPLFTQSCPP